MPTNLQAPSLQPIKILSLLPAASLLLATSAFAEVINVYPGPDENWVYLYDFGDVELGFEAVMTFQIENDTEVSTNLMVVDVYIEDATGPFSVTDAPVFPAWVAPGESIYVEVASPMFVIVPRKERCRERI